MKLKIKQEIPKQFITDTEFKYDFARAKKAISLDMLDIYDNDTIAEEKYDGSRYGAVITDEVKLESRNGIDRAVNVPYICKALKEIFPKDTILDGEICHVWAPRNKRWELSRSVMGTKGYNPEVEPAQYIIYDIQYLDGKCLKDLELTTRREILAKALLKLNDKFEKLETTLATKTLCIPRQFPISYAKQLYLSILSDKGEGIMLKAKKEKYAKSWTKLKKVFSIDCFISGIENGKGKYAGQIGSLKISVFDENKSAVQIGKCSGMDDAKRKEFTQMTINGELLHKVIEVKANEITKNLKLRHPVFIRERYDRTIESCNISQLKEHLK